MQANGRGLPRTKATDPKEFYRTPQDPPRNSKGPHESPILSSQSSGDPKGPPQGTLRNPSGPTRNLQRTIQNAAKRAVIPTAPPRQPKDTPRTPITHQGKPNDPFKGPQGIPKGPTRVPEDPSETHQGRLTIPNEPTRDARGCDFVSDAMRNTTLFECKGCTH